VRVENSWGTRWGDNGWINIAWQWLTPWVHLRQAVAVHDMQRTAVIDQTNEPAWRGGAVNIVPENHAGQVIVPTLRHLVAVEAALKTGSPGRGGDSVTLKIRAQNGQIRTTTSASVPEGFDGFWHFDLPGGGIQVTPGRPITIELAGTRKNVFQWKYAGHNPYPPGAGQFAGSTFGDNDFFFRTYGTP
jgi:hypothetical protein